MIPIIYEANTTSFLTNGLGRLSDAISCKVTEEVNGAFELEMTYPIGGIHFDEIAHSRIIYAEPRPHNVPQPFSIYRITKPMNGIVTIYAEHVSYRLSQCIVIPFSSGTLNSALADLKSHSVIDHPFTFSSDYNIVLPSESPYEVADPASTRAIMGGQDNSIVSRFGGEWEWNGYNCILHQNRGTNRGVNIRYGKNLLDMTQEQNIQSVYTGIVPYWKGQNAAGEQDYVFLDDNGTTKRAYLIKDGIPESYPYQRLKLVDLTNEFDGIPDDDELRDAGEAYLANADDVGVPVVNLTISFISLTETEEYKDIALLEEVNLCDTVTVEFEKLGVSTTAKVVKVVYDVILERYSSLELGEAKSTLAQSVQKDIGTVTKKVDGELSALTTKIQGEIDRASDYIKGGLGGYVMVRENANGQPEELIIADNAVLSSAHNVIRINKNGIGFSNEGYNPSKFITAWTIDGGFTADFISTWSLNASVITAGILKSVNEKVYFDLEHDQLVCSEIRSTNNDYGAYLVYLDLADADDTYKRGALRFMSCRNFEYPNLRDDTPILIIRKDDYGETHIETQHANGLTIGSGNSSIALDSSDGSGGKCVYINGVHIKNSGDIDMRDNDIVDVDNTKSDTVYVKNVRPDPGNTYTNRIDIYGNLYIHGTVNYVSP